MWLAIAITSYFINAGVYVADKFLLSKRLHSSIVYAFYVGIWSIFNFVILIFDPWLPNFQELSIDLLAGGLFLLTLVFWYKALHQSEATRVAPIVGALIPIFSFILSYVFLDATFSERQFLAFLVLIIGGVLISVRQTRFYYLKETSERFREVFGNLFGQVHVRYHPTRRLIFNSIWSALFFASYYVLIKYIYSAQPFIGAFVWSRMGSFIGVLLILLVPDWRRLINKHKQHAKQPKNLAFFLSVRLLAAVAFIMLNWAISLGNVAMINSLQGVQYIFLLIIIIFLSHRFPKILKENLWSGILFQKIIGTILIVLGLYMLIT
ncbi:MAG: EamA family transporter [Patescibacteria group bacterium]|nr:EamA family transporter [Patescibacteria group bacterium]